ncbi:MAG: RnfABCDGE type electron transport complex subunit A [Bacillota bacterium]|nr:RnfABCDGE type electron transport complex subunit A [Bacillota bacterium]
MIGNILTAFITAVFIDNVVLARFLGICPFLGVSQSTKTAASMGAAVVFVMTLASAATWGIQQVLDSFGLGYLQTLAFILVIAALVQFVELFIRKSSDALYRALGVYLPLITTNCAVLGICIVNIQTKLGFVDSILNGAFAGFGFSVAIVLFSGIQIRMQESDIPEALKGFPSALIAASLVSLAFFGFQGMKL